MIYMAKSHFNSVDNNVGVRLDCTFKHYRHPFTSVLYFHSTFSDDLNICCFGTELN